LRVGYVLANEQLARLFDRIRNHFGVGRIPQAGAFAALADQAYLQKAIRQIIAARERIGRIAQQNGLRALPSATNFVAVDCGRDGAFARRVLDGLIARDVFVRMPGVAPLNRCIRISAGTEADLELLAEVLPESLKEAKKG
jgi:histidinol-phosphate aminotransferase